MPRRTRFPDPDQVGTCLICLGAIYRDEPRSTVCPDCREVSAILHKVHCPMGNRRRPRELPPLLRRVVSIHAEG